MGTVTDALDVLLAAASLQLDACGRPPSDAGIYIGAPPADCCTAEGILAAWWSRGYEAGSTPGPNVRWKCQGRPAVDVGLRLYRCWPTAERTDFNLYDPVARLLTDDAFAVTLALVALTCKPGGVFGEGVSAVAFRDYVPVTVAGGCAIVEWRLALDLRPSPADLCPPDSGS